MSIKCQIREEPRTLLSSLELLEWDNRALVARSFSVEDGKLLQHTKEEGEYFSSFFQFNPHTDIELLQALYVGIGDYLKKERQLPHDGQFEAQGKHLEDMRQIVFHKLGIKND